MDNNKMNEEFFNTCKKCTIEKLKGLIDENEINKLLNCMPDPKKNDDDSKSAEASITSAVVWSKVRCSVDDTPWKFSGSAWGPGIGGGSSEGIIYHCVGSWDEFFRRTNGFWAQGIAEVGGGFQINFFDGGSVIGQFNGFMAGAGVFEVGGSGEWEK